MNIGIIGCGTIARVRHAPEYHRNSNCDLKAFYNPNHKKAEQMTEWYGGVCCNSLEELLAMNLDAVSICTPNYTHAGLTIQALDAGLHVLCEKPMALSVEEGEQMIDAAKRNSRILMIGNNQRFTPVHQKAEELIRSGAIGKILSFETVFVHRGPDEWTKNKEPWFYHREKAGSGALGDLGIHKLDLLYYLLKEDITAVSGTLRTLDKKYADKSPVNVEDNAWAILETESGITGSMHVGWTCYGRERNLCIFYGTEGVLRCYDDDVYPLVLECGDNRQQYLAENIWSSRGEKAGFSENSGVIDEFISSIMENRQPVCNGEESLKALKVMEMLIKYR